MRVQLDSRMLPHMIKEDIKRNKVFAAKSRPQVRQPPLRLECFIISLFLYTNPTTPHNDPPPSPPSPKHNHPRSRCVKPSSCVKTSCDCCTIAFRRALISSSPRTCRFFGCFVRGGPRTCWSDARHARIDRHRVPPKNQTKISQLPIPIQPSIHPPTHLPTNPRT